MSLKRDLDERMKGLILNEVDLIIFKDRFVMERVRNMKFPGLKKQIQLMLVSNLGEVQALSIQDMRAVGWIQKKEMDEKIKELEEYKHKYEALCK